MKLILWYDFFSKCMRLQTDFGSIVYAGPYVTAFLTNIYLAKFFAWETGYFNTLDITLDRGGFYLCWGCLCWVQVQYFDHVNGI